MSEIEQIWSDEWRDGGENGEAVTIARLQVQYRNRKTMLTKRKERKTRGNGLGRLHFSQEAVYLETHWMGNLKGIWAVQLLHHSFHKMIPYEQDGEACDTGPCDLELFQYNTDE